MRVFRGYSMSINKNFLQPTGFKIIIDKEKYSSLEYFALSVQHPGSIVNSIEVPIPRLMGMPVTGSKLTYSELSVNLILDEDMSAYKEMQSWMERTVLENETPALYNDITLIILTSHNNGNVRIKYKDCVPTSIGAIEFNSTSGDVPVLTFDAVFRFTEFTIL